MTRRLPHERGAAEHGVTGRRPRRKLRSTMVALLIHPESPTFIELYRPPRSAPHSLRHAVLVYISAEFPPMSREFRTLLCILALACGVESIQAADGQQPELAVFPDSIYLSGADSYSHFVIQRYVAGKIGGQVREGLKSKTTDASVARVEGDTVYAVGDGRAELVVVDKSGVEVRIPIVVNHAQVPVQWEFDAHIQSILSRQGCNSGACHGALAGKGGFRLSLRAYDSLADHFAMTRQDGGRRIETADPGRSLILAKPTTLLPHKGGLRLEEGSENYRILAEWIQAGAPGPQPEDAPLERVEVLPTDVRLAAGDTQQLIVQAHYADGRVEDVTRWAKFNSTNETVAYVDEKGQATIMGPGKGAVVAWFGSQLAITSLTVPYTEELPAQAYADFHPANFIDEILLEEWRALGLAPSVACSDTTFLRRAYLDATGTLPSPQEVREFLGDNRPDRRQRLVDQLLSSENYIDYWAYQWSDLMLLNGNLLRPEAVAAFYTWIREQVIANTPWDEFARAIVLAKGESTKQGATNFYAIHQDPESLTENTCQAFMGLSIGCAKCHNHPLEKWTNDQYYGMANLYARVRAKGWGGDARNGDGQRTLLVLERGDLIQPTRGEPQPPTPLDGEPIDIDSTEDRRIALADWLTSRDNEYFSKAIANRVWANFLGVGLVEQVDDLRSSNPPSSARLLDALAEYLIEHDYDLKALMRVIMQSQAYQLSAEAVPENREDQRFYCRYYPRRLMAEVLHDAIVTVTGVPTPFTEIEFAGADTRATDFYPEGTRSLELYDSAVVNYFLKTFGRHQRRITCDCERSDQPTVVQALHLSNGDTLNEKLADERCVVTHWVEKDIPLTSVIDKAYLLALSRFPSAAERSRLVGLIREADTTGVDRRESFQDLLWSLMTSQEFLFAH